MRWSWLRAALSSRQLPESSRMRVFVAINLPGSERERLHAATGAIKEADFPVRWVAPQNVHLTLKFLGEVPETEVSDVAAAIDEALRSTERFTMTFGGLGAFPSLRRPKVIWVGVEPKAELLDVQSRVESALADLGHPPEKRDFRAHLTIGRGKKGARPARFRGLEELAGKVDYRGSAAVESVDVMRSTLRPSGAEYDVVERVMLRSGGAPEGDGA